MLVGPLHGRLPIVLSDAASQNCFIAFRYNTIVKRHKRVEEMWRACDDTAAASPA